MPATHAASWLTIDNATKLVQAAAIMVGGFAAYYRWFNGRVYKARLETMITGSVVTHDGTSYLTTTASIRNVGLSKVDIQQEGTALRVFSSQEGAMKVTHSMPWTRLATFPAFEDDGWVESSETIEDQRMIAVPDNDCLAFRLELSVYARGTGWKSSTIVNRETQPSRTGRSPKKIITE